MALELNQLHQGDCVEKLAEIDAGSIDLCFADPPFNIGYKYDVYDDRQDDAEYLDWCRQWMGGIHRALKPDGTFWLAIGDEYAAELKVCATRELGFICRSWVIWYYTFGVNCKYGFSRSHTHLFHFVKDPKEFTFNSDDPAIRVPSARQLVYGDGRANPKGRLPDNTWILRPQDLPEGFESDGDTWYFPRVAGTFKERQGFHGCQMPEQLMGRIIRSCSNPGDTVLDPFAGSGTTLVVAKKLGRQWLGSELSEDYAARVSERLAETKADEPLSGAENPLYSVPNTANGKRRPNQSASRPAAAKKEKVKAKKSVQKKGATKKKSAAKKAVVEKTVVEKPVVKKSAVKKSAVKKSAVKKSAAKKSAAKKSAAKKSAAKKSAAKKSAAKKSAVEKSAVEKPAVKKSAVNKSAVKKSAVKKSAAKKSAAKKSAAKKSAVEKPVVEKPVVEKPVVEKPVVEKPVVEKPVVEKPVVKKSAAKKSAVKKSAVKKSAVEKSAVEKSAVEKSAVEKPVVEKPVVKKSAAKKSAVKKSATRKKAAVKNEKKAAAEIKEGSAVDVVSTEKVEVTDRQPTLF